MSFFWGAKDELPGRGPRLRRQAPRAGRGVRRPAARAGPRRRERHEPPRATALRVAETVRDAGPLTGPELREATGLAKKDIDKAVAALHHGVVLTSSHLVEQDGPWGDARARPGGAQVAAAKRLPAREDARRELARVVLDRAGELTAADLAGALGWRRKEAAAVLEEVGDGRDADGFRIWTRR